MISDLYNLKVPLFVQCAPIPKVFEYRRKPGSNILLFLVACCVSVGKLHSNLSYMY